MVVDGELGGGAVGWFGVDVLEVRQSDGFEGEVFVGEECADAGDVAVAEACDDAFVAAGEGL